MMWKHVGEQPHSCNQYNFTSTFSDALQKHKMTHTGEKAHKCHQYLPCVHAPSFKIQMRTHMGEISYKCSQCNYTCTQVNNLHTHMLTHTEVRAFNCDQCSKYIIKHSLSQAQIYEHKEPTFLTMRSPWFDYLQRICPALCLWVGFLKPKTSCKNIVLFA